jgi:hypothetical protein
MSPPGPGPGAPRPLPEPSGSFIGDFRLLDACARPGCPVCRCLGDDSRRYLDGLLREQVTDHETRTALRASRGFCSWHAAMLAGSAAAGFGAAILADDLLARAVARLRAGPGHAPRRAAPGWLSRLGLRRRPPGRPRRRAAAVCPACAWIGGAEDRYLVAVLRLAAGAGFDEAFERSDGLCVPHLELLTARHAGAPALDGLVERTVAKWERLRHTVQSFRDKHDHRSQAPITAEEAAAWRLALEMLAGAPGVFGNDLDVPGGASAAGAPA